MAETPTQKNQRLWEITLKDAEPTSPFERVARTAQGFCKKKLLRRRPERTNSWAPSKFQRWRLLINITSSEFLYGWHGDTSKYAQTILPPYGFGLKMFRKSIQPYQFLQFIPEKTMIQLLDRAHLFAWEMTWNPQLRPGLVCSSQSILWLEMEKAEPNRASRGFARLDFARFPF